MSQPDLRDSTERIHRPWLVEELEDRPTLRKNQIPSIVRPKSRGPSMRAVDAVAMEAMLAANESAEPANIVIGQSSNSTVVITSKPPRESHADVSAAFSTIADLDERPTQDITTKGVRADFRAPAIDLGIDVDLDEPQPEPARPRRPMRDHGAAPASRAFGAGMLQARGMRTPQPAMPTPVDSPAGSLVGAGMLQANRSGNGKLIVLIAIAMFAIVAAFLALR